MKPWRAIAVAMVLCAVAAGNAQARVRRHYHHHHVVVAHGDPRPSAWCGWWMRQTLGVADRSGNLARWWAGYGSNAGGPAAGVIVVWPHHVGLITGRGQGGWVVRSGNDGGRVRERERSLRGVIAYRWPHQSWAMR